MAHQRSLAKYSRALALAFFFLLIARVTPAQTGITINATVVDPNGLPYAFGSVTAQLVPTGGTSPTVNGSPINGFNGPVQMDGNGKFSMNLFCNSAGSGCSVISPSGTQWMFTITNPGVLPPIGFGSIQFVATLTISGASGLTQDISTTLNALAPALSRSIGGGTTSFTNLTSGTNTAAAMVVGTGASLSATGSGTITATNGLSGGTTGFLLKYASATTATKTLCDEAVTTANTITCTDPSGIAAPIFTSTSTTAGFIDYPQGSSNAGVAPCNIANSICDQAPTAVTAGVRTLPGVLAQGIQTQVGSSSALTQGYSGDANHSASPTIGSGTSIGSTQLCSTTNCPVGTYRVNVYLDITTPCGTTGTYLVNLIYTDDQGSKTVPVNIQGTGAVPATGLLTTTSTSNFGQASQILRSTGVASINYSTTAVACGTAGPMVGKLYLSVEPVQ